MNSQMFISFLVSFCMLFLGLMLRFSINDSWALYKKYWLYFIIIGLLLFVIGLFKHVL